MKSLVLESTICEWLKQNSDEIEKAYGIYVDGTIASFIKQACDTIFCAMEYQSDLIRKNEE